MSFFADLMGIDRLRARRATGSTQMHVGFLKSDRVPPRLNRGRRAWCLTPERVRTN